MKITMELMRLFKRKDLDINYSAKGTTIVLFSGELDKAVAALIMQMVLELLEKM